MRGGGGVGDVARAVGVKPQRKGGHSANALSVPHPWHSCAATWPRHVDEKTNRWHRTVNRARREVIRIQEGPVHSRTSQGRLHQGEEGSWGGLRGCPGARTTNKREATWEPPWECIIPSPNADTSRGLDDGQCRSCRVEQTGVADGAQATCAFDGCGGCGQ